MNYSNDHNLNSKPIAEQSMSQQVDSDFDDGDMPKEHDHWKGWMEYIKTFPPVPFTPFPLVFKPPLFTPKILQEVWELSEPPEVIAAHHWSRLAFGGSRIGGPRISENTKVEICWVTTPEDEDKLKRWLWVWFMLTACTISFDEKPELEGIRGKEIVDTYRYSIDKLIRDSEAEN